MVGITTLREELFVSCASLYLPIVAIATAWRAVKVSRVSTLHVT
jgi:hypothetical protein